MQQYKIFLCHNISLNSQQTFKCKAGYLKNQEIELPDVQPIEVVQVLQQMQKQYIEIQFSLEKKLLWLEQLVQNLNQFSREIGEALADDQSLQIDFVNKYEIEYAKKKLNLYKKQMQSSQFLESKWSSLGLGSVILSSQLPLKHFIDQVVPAVLCGNAIVIKASKGIPQFAFVLEKLLASSADDILISLIYTQNENSLKFLLTHPSVKFVIGYGKNKTVSQWVGWLNSVSSQSLKRYQFFSGTKNSVLAVSDPENLDTQKIIDSFFIAQGSLSYSNSRLFTLEKYEEKWIDIIQSYFTSLKPSMSSSDAAGGVLPFSFKEQAYEGIQQQINQDQGSLLKGSEKYLATKNLSKCSILQQDELQFPLLILNTVKYPFDMAKQVNVAYYGFSADIWCEEGFNTTKIIESLDVANISINKWSLENLNWQPGIKQSTFGFNQNILLNPLYVNIKNIF